MSILEKILAILLAVALAGGAGSLWYADHERAAAKAAHDKVAVIQHDADQAKADRQTALDAAAAAQKQLQASEDALNAAQASAAAAIKQADAARDKLSKAAKAPETAKVLDTEVPSSVWGAIYNKADKGE